MDDNHLTAIPHGLAWAAVWHAVRDGVSASPNSTAASAGGLATGLTADDDDPLETMEGEPTEPTDVSAAVRAAAEVLASCAVADLVQAKWLSHCLVLARLRTESADMGAGESCVCRVWQSGRGPRCVPPDVPPPRIRRFERVCSSHSKQVLTAWATAFACSSGCVERSSCATSEARWS